MKILHTSDWHLGRVIYGRSLLEDQQYFIDSVLLPAVDREQPDLVVVAGDIFDRQIAPVDAIRLFGLAMGELCGKRGIPTAVIAGNHDGADRLAVYADLLRPQGLYLSARPFDTAPFVIERGGVTLQVSLLPYFDPAQARELLGRDDLHSFSDAYRAVVSQLAADAPAGRGVGRLLVSHCFAKGGVAGKSESPLAVGGSSEVDTAAFEGFDYVALGHLHGPQQVAANACYSGSPLKYSFDEERQHKCMMLLELDDGRISSRRLPVQPLRGMRTLTGTIKEIIADSAEDTHRGDYIYANLTDTRPVFEPMAALREVYPHVLGLRPGWLNAEPGGGRGQLREKMRANAAADSLFFEEFLRQICGAEPQKQELELFENLMQAVKGEEALPEAAEPVGEGADA